MIRKKRNGLGLAGVLGTMVTLGVVACGDDFSADCMASHTCAVDGGESNQGPAGSGGSDNMPSTSEGGSESMTAGGTAGSTSEPVGGEGGAVSGCSGPEDCDNGNPADGAEVCDDEGKCAPGNAPPVVISVSPEDDDGEVELDAEVVITFSEPLDAASVTTTNIQVLDGANLVEGELVHANGKVTFTPAVPLALLAEYTVKVGPAVKDTEGAGLLEEHTSSFITRDGSWSSVDAATGVIYERPTTLSVTAAGDALVAWSPGGDNYCPVSARWVSGGQPKTTKVFTPHDGVVECRFVAAAANEGGIGAVAWSEAFSDQYVEQYREGKWPAAVGAAESLFDGGTTLAVGVAPNGVVSFLAHHGSTTYARVTSASGSWVAGTPDIGGGREGLSVPSFAFDQDSNGFAAWRAQKANFEEVAVAAFIAGEGWTQATTLPNSPAPSSASGNERGAPAVAVDDAGGAIVLWLRRGPAANTGTLMSSRFTSAGGWAEPVPVSGALVLDHIYDAPGLVFDGTRYVAAWTAKKGSSYDVYSAAYDVEAEAWAAPEPRATAAVWNRMPGLGVDTHGNLLMTWVQAGAFMFARYDGRAGAWSEAARIDGGTVKDEAASGRPLPLGVGANGHAAVAWTDENAQGQAAKLRVASFY